MPLSLKTLKNEISIDSQFAKQYNQHEIRLNANDYGYDGNSASDLTAADSNASFDVIYGNYRLFSNTNGRSQVYIPFNTIPGHYYTFQYDYITRSGSQEIRMGLVSEEPNDTTKWDELPWLLSFTPTFDQSMTFKADSEITYFVAAHFSTANNTDYIRFDSIRLVPCEVPKNLKIEQFNMRSPTTNYALYNMNVDEYYQKHTYGDKAYFTLYNYRILTMSRQSEITIRGTLEND